MKFLVSSLPVLLAVSLCRAKTDTVPDQHPAPTTPAEATIKTVRSTVSTAVQNAIGHVPAQQNSLSSSQDGLPKQTQQPHNNANTNQNTKSNAILLSNYPANIVHANGQSNSRPLLPPSQSHQQLQQYVRAFAALPKPQEYNHQLSQIKSNEIQPSRPVYSQLQNGGQNGGYNHAPGAASATGGYILSVNTENGQTLTSSGPTPVIMQYLPQTQPTSGIQYLQLIPTRPLIVPISPYMSPLPAQHQPNVQHHQPQHLHHPQHHLSLHHRPPQYVGVRSPSPPTAQSIHPYSNYAAGQSYLSAGQIYQHPPNQSPHTGAHYPVYQTSNGGFAAASSSAPVISFFRPHTGIQLVNGPVDMSLNTNEYIPTQSESAYKMRRV